MKAIICDQCGKVLKTKRELEETVTLQMTAEGCKAPYLTSQLCGECAKRIEEMIDGERHEEEYL